MLIKTVKIWALLNDTEFTAADTEYCISSNIQVRDYREKVQHIPYGNLTYQFNGLRNIQLFTFDEKSETMLQLRYGGRVVLAQTMQYDSATHYYEY